MRLLVPLISFFWIITKVRRDLWTFYSSWWLHPAESVLHIHIGPYMSIRVIGAMSYSYPEWFVVIFQFSMTTAFPWHYCYLCPSILAASWIIVSGSTYMQANTNSLIYTHRMDSVSGVSRQQGIIHGMNYLSYHSYDVIWCWSRLTPPA